MKFSTQEFNDGLCETSSLWMIFSYMYILIPIYFGWIQINILQWQTNAYANKWFHKLSTRSYQHWILKWLHIKWIFLCNKSHMHVFYSFSVKIETIKDVWMSRGHCQSDVVNELNNHHLFKNKVNKNNRTTKIILQLFQATNIRRTVNIHIIIHDNSSKCVQWNYRIVLIIDGESDESFVLLHLTMPSM